MNTYLRSPPSPCFAALAPNLARALGLLVLMFYSHLVQAQCPAGLVQDTLDWSDSTLGWQSSMDGDEGPHTLYSDQGVAVEVTFLNSCSGTYQGGTPLRSSQSGGSIDDLWIWVNWPNDNCQISVDFGLTVDGADYDVENFSFTVKDIDQDSYDDQIVYSPSPTSITRGNRIRSVTDGGHGRRSCAADDTGCWMTAQWDGPDSSFGFVYDAGPQSPSDPAQQWVWISDLSFCVDASTVPVTLSAFQALASADGVRFDWTTATETGNVGFHLYQDLGSGWQRLNERLIPSHDPDSLVPQHYELEAAGVTAQAFLIADVDIFGRERRHGPFSLGEVAGTWEEPEPVDWAAVRDERAARPAARRPAPGAGFPVVALQVDTDGLYRVTAEQLQAAGVDFNGAPGPDMALTNRGRKVPVRVEAPDGVFGTGDYLEFYGEAVDSLYTRVNVYYLQVNPGLAKRIKENNRPVPAGAPAPYYLETVEIHNNRRYSFAAPNADPWFDTAMLAYTSSRTWHFDIDIDELVVGTGQAPRLQVGLWGVTDWPQRPDHHVVVDFNGVRVADEQFDGLVNKPLQVNLQSAGSHVREGTNVVSITLPGDTGVDYDLVNLDRYALTYPRAFVARNGALTFKAVGAAFEVVNLPSPDVVVYARRGAKLKRHTAVTVDAAGDGTYTATFRGNAKKALEYSLATVGALGVPGIAPAQSPEDITSGNAQYLMISHPDFIAGLAPLVAARRAEGFVVRVVSVDDVYAHFSDGIVDAAAIRAYIAHGAKHMGTEYVLLVGGDTYDYFDYLGKGSVSFVPSLYTQTGAIVRYTPADPLFTDLDGDKVPDLPIGRLPVRTQAELDSVVAKTLAYPAPGQGQTAVFAADRTDGVSYARQSDGFIDRLPLAWDVQRAYLDDLGVVGAREVLLGAMDDGVALASFFGHSGPTTWTFDGLFSADDAAALMNAGRPMVVTQWGCWNTYHVEPRYHTLAHKLLLSGDRGAAAVLGASTLTDAVSERALGRRVMKQLMRPGQTLGGAVQRAKEKLANRHPQALDVLLGWTLLGDPTLVLEPAGR